MGHVAQYTKFNDNGTVAYVDFFATLEEYNEYAKKNNLFSGEAILSAWPIAEAMLPLSGFVGTKAPQIYTGIHS